jgi:uncharacterized protein YcbX
MRVAGLWRYPVKSLQGEQLESVTVASGGLEGDRRYGIFDPESGLGFRSNVLLDGEGEDSLVGSRVTLGGVTLAVGKRISRCVMITRPQAGGVERDLDVLRTVARERDACLAVGALVAQPGVLRVGDELRVKR